MVVDDREIRRDRTQLRDITDHGHLRGSHCQFCTSIEIDPEQTMKMGINARMMTGINLDQIPVRHIDGASF